MNLATKIGIGIGAAGAIGLLIWAKAGSAVNFVNNLTFDPLWYGGIDDMKVSTAGIKLPLAVDLGNRSDQSFKVRLNAVDVYRGGSKIAASTPSLREVVLAPYSTQRVKLDVVIGISFLTDLGISIFNISGSLNKILDSFKDIQLRVDFTINDTVQTPLLIDFETGEVKMDGVGLVPTSSHQVGSKNDYVGVIPAATELKHSDKIVIKDVTPEQTAVFVRNSAKKYRWQTAELANELRVPNNPYQTVKNVFDFVFKYIQYTPDSTQSEDVRLPLRSLHDQKGDCDCMTLLICSIFENLGIPYTIRIAEYDNKGYFQHIYAIARLGGRAVPCDPVVQQFDYEKPFTNHKDF